MIYYNTNKKDSLVFYNSHMSERISDVARLCLSCLDRLPKSGKASEMEWEIVSGIVVEIEGVMEVLSLATGSKCLGEGQLSPCGGYVNDCHAEVLARRALLHVLDDELAKEESQIFRKESSSAFLKPRVKFHLYTNQIPCGDASIFQVGETDEYYLRIQSKKRLACGKRTFTSDRDDIINQKRVEEKLDVQRTGAKVVVSSKIQDSTAAGISYHAYKVLRTKPGRGMRTSSLSCSDKIARWNVTGIQGALLSTILKEPIYLSSITVQDMFCYDSLHRSLVERIRECSIEQEKLNYSVNTSFHIQETSIIHNRTKGHNKEAKYSSANAIVWARSGLQEVLIGSKGKKLGVTKKRINEPKSRSGVCKIERFLRFERLTKTHFPQLHEQLDMKNASYNDVKAKAVWYQTNKKEFLKQNFYFKEWMINPASLEAFTCSDDSTGNKVN